MKIKLRHPFCFVIVSFNIILGLFLIVFIPVSLALKPGEVSYTAEMGAGMRAIAAMDPDAKIRNPDYLAIKFLTPNFWLFGPLRKDYLKTKQFIKFYRVSRYYTINAATWHIDGILQKTAANNLKQVVIIGSGFDSRPYRFAKQMEKVRFYELDLPATQKRKQKILEDEFGRLPEAVTYIPINYRSQTFLDALKHAGYDENQKTLFIWEASMVFTERNIVENTLQSIAQNSAPESELVFGYVFDELVQGNYNRYMGAWYASVRLKAAGEPWTFGIPEGKANEFMVHLGFKVISDLGAKELAQKYLVRGDGEIDGKPTPFMRIMHAVVAR